MSIYLNPIGCTGLKRDFFADAVKAAVGGSTSASRKINKFIKVWE